MKLRWMLAAVVLVGCSSSSSETSPTTDADTTETSSTGGDGAPLDDAAAPGTATDSAPAAVSLEGYWVWKEIVEDDKTTTTITDDDMTWKVGPSGWSGCPDGISCTRYGIDVLYVNATRFHHMYRVTTGSDYQRYGSYTVAGDLLTFTREQAYSCAHPKETSTYPSPGTLYARVKRRFDDLWMSELFSEIPTAPKKWIVYRPTTKTDAHNKYDHPFCGEMREGGACHCLCPSQDVLKDYTCAK